MNLKILESTKKLVGTIWVAGFNFKKKGKATELVFGLGEYKAYLARKKTVSFVGHSLSEAIEYRWMRCRGRAFIRPENEPNPHILITGMSGFGKSTLCRSLLADIGMAGKRVIVFDAHNEHEGVVNGMQGTAYNALHAGINIMELDGASVGERITELRDLIKNVYGLGHIQATKLGECLWYTYRKFGAIDKSARHIERTPRIRDLIAELNIFIVNAKSAGERNTLLHLKSRVSMLNTSAFNENLVSVESLKNGISSFSLAELRSREAQEVYISELLRRLYSSMKSNAKEEGLSYYIMIDEAQFLMGASGGGVITKLMEEGRKYGVGLIIATHSASNLNKQIVANAGTVITFFSREPTELNYISNLLGGSDSRMASSVKAMIGRLGQHRALVSRSGVMEPFLVQTAKMADPVHIGSRSEEKLKLGILEFAKHPVNRGALEKMFGEEKIDGLLERLVSEKRLSTMKTFYGEEEEWFMKYNTSLSIEHEVSVRAISESLQRRGIWHRLTWRSIGPDIIASVNGKKVAIEYETGRKYLEETRTMLERRAKEFDLVLVFVNDAHYTAYKDNFESGKIRVHKMDELEDVLGNFGGEAHAGADSAPPGTMPMEAT